LPLFLKSKTGLPLNGSHGNPVLLPSDFGNPAIPEGPVAFRPMIAHGLALSGFLFSELWIKQLPYQLNSNSATY
jgi:hypothetical protein